MNLIVLSLTRTTKTSSIYSDKVTKLYQIEIGASVKEILKEMSDILYCYHYKD